jgi:hypothetical protein
MYAQVRADRLVSSNVALALEAAHFEVGDSIRARLAHGHGTLGASIDLLHQGAGTSGYRLAVGRQTERIVRHPL